MLLPNRRRTGKEQIGREEEKKSIAEGEEKGK